MPGSGEWTRFACDRSRLDAPPSIVKRGVPPIRRVELGLRSGLTPLEVPLSRCLATSAAEEAEKAAATAGEAVTAAACGCRANRRRSAASRSPRSNIKSWDLGNTRNFSEAIS